MITLDQFKEQTETAIAAVNSLMKISRKEIEEQGKPEDSTCRYINALYYAINEAYNMLSKGIEGKFPWEKEEKENE